MEKLKNTAFKNYLSFRLVSRYGIHNYSMAVLCEMPTIQYSAGSAWLYLIGGALGPPKSSTQTASRSLRPFLQGSQADRQKDRQTDKQTDHATRSITIGGIYVRSTVMWSINNCSISRLLDWSPCFYRHTEQGNRRQQT